MNIFSFFSRQAVSKRLESLFGKPILTDSTNSTRYNQRYLVLANFLIGLREGLEMALIVSILVVSIVKANRPDVLSKLWIGVGIALIVPFGIGALLTWGPYGLTFQAQETLGGALSLVAVGFVTWMIFWMRRTAHTMKAELHNRLASVLVGSGWGVVALAALSVGREGIETALFVWATVDSVGGGWVPLVGAVLGLATAALIGTLLYRGMIRMNLTKFFTWTGGFLILIAAGVLAYGIGDLQEAGAIPGGGNVAYDISGIVPPSSWYGAALMGVINFNPTPSWLQVVAWISYVSIVSFFYVRQGRTGARDASPSPRTESSSAPCSHSVQQS